MLLWSTLRVVFFVIAATSLRAQAPDFACEVQPVLAEHCYPCHGPDARQRKAFLRLDSFAAATAKRKDGLQPIAPRDPANSALLARINSHDPAFLMPPPEAKKPLTEKTRALLHRWIETGAGYTQHWAFLPPQQQRTKGNDVESWCRDDLDREVLARLHIEGLTPSPAADRATLLRRAHLVLTGLPPSTDEVAAFETDLTTDAYERRVDDLLQRPAYAEHLASTWLDLARFADTYGYQSDFECRTWPWRDWLIDAFARDLPYDELVTQMIAGDLLPAATQQTRIATAFFRLHRQTNEGGSIEAEWRHEYIADRVDTFGTAFLGLTVGCARCHDHKFDPIPQRDYYALGSYFAIDECGLYPYSTGGIPQPTLRLSTTEQDLEIARLTAEVNSATQNLTLAIESAPTLDDLAPLPAAIAHYTFNELANGKTADTNRPDKPADVPTGVVLTDGERGKALQFDGDSGITLPGIQGFSRDDAFSFTFYIWCPDHKDRAVVLHTSSYTEDADTQGYQVLLREGQLCFEIAHHWPGSAIALRTAALLPLQRWIHVAVTYDGSSRANGMAIYLDGVRADTAIVRDHLAGPAHVRTLQLGARDRDRGFTGGRLDDLMVFARALGSAEILLLATGVRDDSATAKRQQSLDTDQQVLTAREKLTAARKGLHGYVESLPELMVLAENATPPERFVLQRGAYDQPDRTRPVQPDALTALLPFAAAWPRSRLGLAAWTTSPDNPLTARVEVNRLWAQCFGQGLVRTQENFGVLGEVPAQRLLLDALAFDFKNTGWRIKPMLRRIVTSATFRQQSVASASLRERDPDNRLLARGPSFRLSAETLRDQALAAAGLLSAKVGGNSVKPWQPAGLWSDAGVSWGGGDYQPDQGQNAHRRSLYTYRKRTAPPPNLLTLDGTSREVCVARRQSTNTPLQSLVFFNDRVFLECAEALADRMSRELPFAFPAQLDRAFIALSGRAPRPAEHAAMQTMFDLQRAAFFDDQLACSKLLFLLANDPERASLLMVCSTLLASDAVMVMR